MSGFAERSLDFVRQIPKGKVATYGQIAALAGSPRAAITVGQILHNTTDITDLPWQRVINSKGYISTTCLEHPPAMQAALLESDGVTVENRSDFFVIDLKKHQWERWTQD